MNIHESVESIGSDEATNDTNKEEMTYELNLEGWAGVCLAN